MATPGTPTLVLPAYSTPVFTASNIAVGGAIAPIKLENTSASGRTNVPFRFAQPFKKGDIAPGNFIVGKIAGQADVPLQFNVLATWQDGSVRHAMVSGVLPNIGANAVVTMNMVRSASGPSTTAIAASAFANLSAKALLNFDGVAYTADAGPAIAALAANKARIAGEIATEYNVTLSPKTTGGAAHPAIETLFDVTYFPATNSFKIDVTFEHTKNGNMTGDVAYSGTIEIGGATAYTLPNPLTHHPRTRWMRPFWQNNASPLIPCHDRDYFIDSKAVVNYDRRVTISETTLANYATTLSGSAFDPMKHGIFAPGMAGTGGRPDIGLLPGPYAAAVLSMDKRAIALTLAAGRVGGSWNIHYRDTSTGPGAGLPMSTINWPYATAIQSAAEVNPATGQNEWITMGSGSGGGGADDSHTPNFAYLPYLFTGDKFYQEEMHFWIMGLMLVANYAYRGKEKNLVYRTQTRGQAWLLRGLVECGAFTPDAHPLKSHFKYWVDSNFDYYNTKYPLNPLANVLGVLDTGDDLVYTNGRGIGVFQYDFFVSVVGHARELGYAAAQTFLLWAARWPIGRMIAPGYCYLRACPIGMTVRDSPNSPLYETHAQCLIGHIGDGDGANLVYTQAIHDAPCNSQQRLDLMNAQRGLPSQPFVLNEISGYSYSTEGYVSNMQPGLALAVDSGYADGDLAWDLYDNRANQPNYSTSPQFAVVPRPAAPPDDYSGVAGQIMYIGRAA